MRTFRVQRAAWVYLCGDGVLAFGILVAVASLLFLATEYRHVLTGEYHVSYAVLLHMSPYSLIQQLIHITFKMR